MLLFYQCQHLVEGEISGMEFSRNFSPVSEVKLELFVSLGFLPMKTSLFISFYFYHSRLSISSHTQTLKRRDAQICHGTEFIADFTIHIKITNRAEKMASQGQINLISETSAFPLGMGGEDMEVNAAFRHFFNVKFRQINFYFYFHSLAFSPRK